MFATLGLTIALAVTRAITTLLHERAQARRLHRHARLSRWKPRR